MDLSIKKVGNPFFIVRMSSQNACKNNESEQSTSFSFIGACLGCLTCIVIFVTLIIIGKVLGIEDMMWVGAGGLVMLFVMIIFTVVGLFTTMTYIITTKK